jgi:hypothetical protein
MVVGATWLGSVAGGATADRGAGVADPALVVGAVSSDGVPSGAGIGWRVHRVDSGVYELEFAEPTTVAMRTWTAVADVTARPVSDTAWIVAFEAVGSAEPVDTAFTFLASPAG